ncbi:hypothetical protein C9439_05010 [archaeon SCG-AAA382B04]|nr:hypothetical protein C9439_05010 [archaeon SCG-AAA382B04]
MNKKLENLGFEKDRTIETILLTKKQGQINLAPIGIRRKEQDFLEAKIYKTTQAYSVLNEGDIVSLNLTNDAELFFKSIFDKKIETEDFKIKKSDYIIKSRCKRIIEKENYIITHLIPKEVIKNKETKKGYCRANSAIIEALVYYTKLDYEKRDKVERKITQAKKVVKKTGGEKEKELIKKIISRI